ASACGPAWKPSNPRERADAPGAHLHLGTPGRFPGHAGALPVGPAAHTQHGRRLASAATAGKPGHALGATHAPSRAPADAAAHARAAPHAHPDSDAVRAADRHAPRAAARPAARAGAPAADERAAAPPGHPGAPPVAARVGTLLGRAGMTRLSGESGSISACLARPVGIMARPALLTERACFVPPTQGAHPT